MGIDSREVRWFGRGLEYFLRVVFLVLRGIVGFRGGSVLVVVFGKLRSLGVLLTVGRMVRRASEGG